MLKVYVEKCIGCQACMAVCPFNAIIIVDDKAQIDDTLCGKCGQCVEICPADAIIEEQSDKEEIVPIDITKGGSTAMTQEENSKGTQGQGLVSGIVELFKQLIEPQGDFSGDGSILRNQSQGVNRGNRRVGAGRKSQHGRGRGNRGRRFGR